MAGLSADHPIDRADACGMGAREFDQHEREMRAHRQEGCGDAPDLRHNRVRATELQLRTAVRDNNPATLCHRYVTAASPQELAEAVGRLDALTQTLAVLTMGSLIARADVLRETMKEAGLYLTPDPEPGPALTMDAAKAIYNAIPFHELAQEAAAKLRERRAAEAGV